MARIRADYVFGTTTAALTAADTTLSSAELARLPEVASPDVAAVTLHDGTNYEIVHVTAHTAAATTATILRGQEGSTAQAWASGADWNHGATSNDFAAATAGAGQPAFDVVAYGAVVDGTTDDTAAWQAAINAAAAAGGGRVISSLNGVSIIGGALQDTAGANAQIVLPAIDAVDSEQITVTIEGTIPPPTTFSVVGATPIPDGHLVLKSTLASGTGAVIGAKGPAGTYENFTNLCVLIRNLTIRTPSNPTNSALDLRRVTGVELDNVVVDCGSYYVQGLTEPTTATSYGIRLPANNNGAFTRLGAVNVAGFYTGYEFAEHSVGEQVAAWGCKRAFVFVATNHASKFQRLMAVHCERGMVFTGTHYVDVDQFNIEHAASGWWITDYDIDDASNYGHGSVNWHVVLANVGIDATFTKNGGTGITATRVGATVGGGSSRSPVTVNAQTGTAYTLVLADAGAFVTMTNAAASTLTVPPNSSVAFPVGTVIEGAQLGAGQVTLTPGAGVTINATPGLKVAAQYGTFGLLKTATDTWLAMGRLAA